MSSPAPLHAWLMDCPKILVFLQSTLQLFLHMLPSDCTDCTEAQNTAAQGCADKNAEENQRIKYVLLLIPIASELPKDDKVTTRTNSLSRRSYSVSTVSSVHPILNKGNR